MRLPADTTCCAATLAAAEGQRASLGTEGLSHGCRGHWWSRLTLNTEHLGNPGRALEAADAALADPWLRGGHRLDVQRRALRLGKPPRRWRQPPWADDALWEPPVHPVHAAPVTSGVGLGYSVRNKCAASSACDGWLRSLSRCTWRARQRYPSTANVWRTTPEECSEIRPIADPEMIRLLVTLGGLPSSTGATVTANGVPVAADTGGYRRRLCLAVRGVAVMASLRTPRKRNAQHATAGRPQQSGRGCRRFASITSGEHISVEDFVLEHFAQPASGGWRGVHSEGGVWATLFGLLLFPALFHSVPDVFRTPFQSAPLDLSTDAFAPARAHVLNGLLRRLRAGDGVAMLRDTWHAQRGAAPLLLALAVLIQPSRPGQLAARRASTEQASRAASG